MKIESIGWVGCKNKTCPAVYKTNKNSYLIQGYKIANNGLVDLPENENLIEIPADMFEDLIRTFENKKTND